MYPNYSGDYALPAAYQHDTAVDRSRQLIAYHTKWTSFALANIIDGACDYEQEIASLPLHCLFARNDR